MTTRPSDPDAAAATPKSDAPVETGGSAVVDPSAGSSDAVDSTATDPVEVIATLAEPTRRALFDWVTAQRRAVGRDEAAAAVGIARALAAHHLDRLASAGLLATEYRRLSGRTGPGAGRPAKLYRRAAGAITISLPERRYELAATLLAEGVEADARTLPPAGVREAGTRHGRSIGRAARRRAGPRPSRRALRSALVATLDEEGYAPVDGPGGEIRLGNCPFDALVAGHRDLVCGMNLMVAQGMLEELGDDRLTARLDAQPGWCCVAIGVRAAD